MSGKIFVAIAVVAGVAAGIVACWYHAIHPNAVPATESLAWPAPAPGRDPIMSRVVNSGPMARPRDFFETIEQPQFIAADDAGDLMADDEVVLGLEIGGVRRAYPINYLNDHEMVREEIAGRPLLVTW